MDYPDEELKHLQIPLKRFVSLARDLHSSNEKEAFLRFVLAGRLDLPEGSQARVFVNAQQGTSPPARDKYQIHRDIDSIVGVSRDLPYKGAMAVFPLPSFRDTLTEKNHLKYQSSLVPETNGVSLHKIPNMALGKVDRRHITRMCFPRMYQKGASPAIPSDLREAIYNDCIRPSVGAVSPSSLGRWPLNLEMAMLLYRDEKGQFHHGTIDLPSHLLPAFSSALLDRFQGHVRKELHDAFFLHELRGIKSATCHDHADQKARETAFDDAVRYFHLHNLDPEEWHVDVALEVYQPNCVLQWLVQGHLRILRFILPSATDDQLEAVLKSKLQYTLDISAQIAELGGFRARPGSRGKSDRVTYINVYSTDKSATYQLHDGVFKRRKAWHLFPDSIKSIVTSLGCMANAFRLCGGDGDPSKAVIEGNVRMEARVSLSVARQFFLAVPDRLIQHTVVAYDCPTLWYFKYYRAVALYLVVKSFENVPPHIRLGVTSLMLGAVIIYQINAIVYRPGDGKAEPYLLEACCQHVSGGVDVSSVPIMYGRGIYFLSDLIKEGGAYRLPTVRPVDSWVLEALYRRESMSSIKLEFFPETAKSLSKKRPRTRGESTATQASKKRKALPAHGDTEREQEQLWEHEVRGIFSTDSPIGGREEEESVLKGNRTTSEAEELEGLGNGTDDGTPRPDVRGAGLQHIQKALATIKRTFAKDVLSCAPKPRGNTTPWMLLSTVQQESATLAVFISPDFGQVLRQVQRRNLSTSDWRTLAFERYFPSRIKEGRARARQNFTRAEYLKTWESLLHTLDDDTVSKVTETVYAWFQDLYWIPLPDSDRMWNTKRSKSDSDWVIVPESTVRQLCPRIAINSVRQATLATHPYDASLHE